jgi:aryl-alcohol dehydrogenase-like predicted oxidoreductase
MNKKIILGCGLIGIGREWGYIKTKIPNENEAIDFLKYAYKLGITFFDTAPSYGTSEERLGKFLKTLFHKEREKITVATKFGEHWNNNTHTAYVDHSYDALVRSLEKSLSRLGKIDILQVHKTSPVVLKSKDLLRAIDYAYKLGITTFGASVSDMESAEMVLKSDIFSVIQLPFNISNTVFLPIIQSAKEKKKIIIVNRPFDMGALMYTKQDKTIMQKKAYDFIVKHEFNGIILTGTKSKKHLEENIKIFNSCI